MKTSYTNSNPTKHVVDNNNLVTRESYAQLPESDEKFAKALTKFRTLSTKY